MKFLNNQAVTKLSTLLLLVSTTGLALNPFLPSEAKEVNLSNQTSEIVIAQNTQSKNTFTAVGKQQPTTGTVNVVTENGKRYLVFSSDFSTPNGPDVFVILHRDSQVENNIKEKDYINVAKLEKFAGGQRYLIGDDVNLDDFQSIGIWCREFNVTFAYTSLQ